MGKYEFVILDISICSFGAWQYYKFSGIFFKENNVGSLIGFTLYIHAPPDPI